MINIHTMTKSSIKNTYTYSYGRRKSAIAAVKLFKGKGDSTVNGVKVEDYFPGNNSFIAYTEPFATADVIGKFYFQAKLSGGGKTGQLKALVLAISRTLFKENPEVGTPLKAKKLLSVDSRVRQRRMVGTGGKARRQKQSPKR